MKIISHSADADGRLSAFLVARKFGITDENDIIMTDYGKGSDFIKRINKGEKVVICDFSFENGPDDMKKLMEITDDIIWIDHHESSIKKYSKFGDNIPGIRVVGTAACMLTYIYFYILSEEEGALTRDQWCKLHLDQKYCENLYKYAPLLVRYVHDNDVWRYDYGEKTEFFKLGLDSSNAISPLNPIWENLFTDVNQIDRLINIGISARKYRDSLASYIVNSEAFEYTIGGKHGLCMNMILGGSPWFGEKIKEYDFVCSFHYNGKQKQWEYSFYSDSEKGANCYKLAQSVDPKGGGHEHAAGCTSDKLIFK